ncbi:putative glycolipid-binding domain-containing protein [Streptodolium elevatio]|uniref:Glycolipid-binding domain-containing protein n=1 Tax=Streptodolium elevatio TaxID=3157996 RepID=A0ABV3DB48_9ACTN
MGFAEFPGDAGWRHVDARDGFEAAWFRGESGGGRRIDGTAVAVEDGLSWAVRYRILLGPTGRTLRAEVESRSVGGRLTVVLEADGEGSWLVDGAAAPELDGCLDVDLEASALTNAFPVRRLGLAVGERASAPAAYVRAADATVGRLEQTYLRVEDEAAGPAYDYEAPAFDFACRLRYDASGLALDYPGIAVRVR